MIDAVRKFASTMQHKLDKNKHKPCEQMNPNETERTWEECDPHWLLMRLREETIELEQAIWKSYGASDNNTEAVMCECADVGNFAMMIHDIFCTTGGGIVIGGKAVGNEEDYN